MVQEDQQIVRVDKGVLRRALKKIVRVLCQELVERVGGGNQHSQRSFIAPASATGLLPGSRNRPRVANQQRGTHLSDVDAELEGVGRHDQVHIPLAQAVLYLAPLVR